MRLVSLEEPDCGGMKKAVILSSFIIHLGPWEYFQTIIIISQLVNQVKGETLSSVDVKMNRQSSWTGS